ncbi:monoglyceride lipase-like isoform X2 [Haemaphysalis longicornis]
MMWTGISKHFRSRVRGWTGILRADPNGLRTLQVGVLRATANKTRALVFLAHGFGEHCHGDTYHTVARDLTRVGCYVFAHDHVGHGKSEGPRATIKSFDTYVDDILTHVDMRRTDFPGKPIYLFGHSMGGLLCVLTVQRKPKDFAGMVLLGPLLGIDKQEATWFKRTMAVLLGSVVPNFPLGKLSLEKVSSDPAVVKRLAEDPLRYHGSVTAAWGAAALSALEDMQANVEAVKLPFLIEHGSADKLCDPADSHQFYEKAASEDKTLKIIAGAYHCLLTEPGGVNRQVRKDIVNWISGRLPKK